MADNVVALTDDVKLPDLPAPDVVEMLRDMLAQAERGEIAALACCYVTSNQRLTTDWAYLGSVAGHLLVSAASRLLYRLNQARD